jgi:hypothetical protein
MQRQQHHHCPGGLPPPAVQVSLQLLDFTGWTLGEHADRAHTDHDLAGWVDDVATSIQPPARLMSTLFAQRYHSGLRAELMDRRLGLAGK